MARRIAEGDARAMAEARMQGLEGARKRFNSAMEAFGISLGNVALPSLTRFLEELTPFVARLAEIGSQTDSIVQKISAAVGGPRDGLQVGGGDLFGPVRRQFQAFERFLFGTDVRGMSDSAAAQNLAAAGGQVHGLRDRFRELGEAIRGLAFGDVRKLRELADAVGALLSSFGGAAAAIAGIGALKAISGAVARLGIALLLSPVVRIAAAAKAISDLVAAVRSADGVGDGFRKVIDALSDPVTLFGAGVALWFLAKRAMGLVKALQALRGAVGAGAGAASAGAGAGAGAAAGNAGRRATGSRLNRGLGAGGAVGGALLVPSLSTFTGDIDAETERAASNRRALNDLAENSIFGTVNRAIQDLRRAVVGSGGAEGSGVGPTRVAADLERIVDLYRRLGEVMAEDGSRSRSSRIATLREEIDGLVTNMPEVARLGEDLAASIAAGSDQAVAEASRIESALRVAFQRAAAAAQTAGTQVGPRMAAGIRSGIPAVRAASREMAQAVANHFPQSPVKEGPLRGLPTIGAKIAEQLAGGMTSGPLSTRAAAMAGAMTAAMVPSAAGGTMAAGAGPTVTVTIGDIVVQGASDPRRTAEEVSRRIGEEVAAAMRGHFGDGGL